MITTKRFAKCLFYLKYIVPLFFTSILSSVFFFGNNPSGIIKDAKALTVEDNSEALVTAYKVTNDLIDDWSLVKTKNTEEYKYVSSVSRFYTFNIGDDEIDILESNTDIYDQHYSFMHVYCGTEGSWSLLKEPNSIIISRQTQRIYNLNLGDNLNVSNKFGNQITFKIVGICGGTPNSDRTSTDNIFADLFGLFGFIAEDTLDIAEDGYFQRIQTGMPNRQLSRRFANFFDIRKKYDFNYKISSQKLENKLKFCDKLSNNKTRYFIGLFFLVTDIGILIMIWDRREKNILHLDYTEIKTYSKLLQIIIYFGLWFIGLFFTRNLNINYGDYVVKLKDINSYTLNTLVMLFALLILFFPSIKCQLFGERTEIK